MKVCGLTREDDVAAAAEAGADLLGFVLAPESPRAADRVLPVPNDTLAVAVWVGAAGPSAADLDQVLPHGSQVVHVVERRDRLDVRRRQVERICDLGEGLRRQPAPVVLLCEAQAVHHARLECRPLGV